MKGWLCAGVLLGLATAAGAQSGSEPAAPVDPAELEQRVKVLERRLELAEEQAAEKARSAPTVTAGADGFAIRSADGAFQLRLRALIQEDGRFFFGDETSS